MSERRRMSDEAWFERYGPTVGASVVAVADPERVRTFNALVAPLEQAAGKALNQPGRGTCFAAFCEDEDGFRRRVDEAAERGTRNTLGLLIRMVQAGEHRIGASHA